MAPNAARRGDKRVVTAEVVTAEVVHASFKLAGFGPERLPGDDFSIEFPYGFP